MQHLLLTILIAAYALPLSAAPAGDPTPDEQFPPAIMELTLESAGSRMPGLLYQANGPGPHPTVVLLHGFPGNEKNLDIAQQLRREGFNVLFFHYRGAWGADGDFSILNLTADVNAVLNYLRDPEQAATWRVDRTKLSLLGHSLGGYTALAAGSREDDLTCVGAMAPANIGLWKLALGTEEPGSTRILDYADTLFMLRGLNAGTMLEDLRKAPLETLDTRAFGKGLKGKSVFMVVGDKDPVTPAQGMFKPTVEAYQQVPGLRLEHHVISGDHSFSWSRLQLTGLITQWMSRDCR